MGSCFWTDAEERIVDSIRAALGPDGDYSTLVVADVNSDPFWSLQRAIDNRVEPVVNVLGFEAMADAGEQGSFGNQSGRMTTVFKYDFLATGLVKAIGKPAAINASREIGRRIVTVLRSDAIRNIVADDGESFRRLTVKSVHASLVWARLDSPGSTFYGVTEVKFLIESRVT